MVFQALLIRTAFLFIFYCILIGYSVKNLLKLPVIENRNYQLIKIN